MTLRAAAAFLVLALALPAGARIQYVTTVNGQPITGSEVCFYRSNAFEDVMADLAVTAIRCYPADLHLDVPAGTFTVLARNVAEGLVAQTPGFLAIRDATAEQEYQSSSMAMVPAAFVDVTDAQRVLGADEHLVLIFGATKRTRPYLHPVTREDSTILVPPETPFVMVRVKGGKPVAISDTASLPARSRARAPRFGADANFVVATAQVVEPEDFAPPTPVCLLLFSNAFLERINAIEKPDIVLVHGRTEVRPLFPVQEAGQLNVAPLVFRGVPHGKGEIQVRGDHWTHTSRPVAVAAGERVVTVTPPLKTEPAALMTVRWDVPADVQPARSTCDEKPVEEARELLLLRCAAASAAADPATIPDSACDVIGKRTLGAERGGAEVFRGVARGNYIARLRYGTLPMAQTVVTAPLGGDVETPVSAQPLGIYGRVTRAGAPVAATVTFSSGTGVSDARTGEYYALVTKAPGRRTVRVQACDESFVHMVIPDRDVPPNSRFDIAVPTNDVTLRVLGDSGPVGEGVAVSLAVNDPRQPGTAAFSLRGVTDASGRATIAPVTPASEVVICATAADYLRTCLDPIRIEDEHTSVDLRLRRPAGTGVAPAGYERIYWVLPDGRVSEDSAIQPETGAFTYKTRHAPPEYLALVGAQRPLLVLAQPDVKEGAPFTIAMPQVPTRAFTITTSPESAQESAMLTLAIGGRIVPVNAFLMHQKLRAAPFLLIRRAPVPVRDIAATGPLTVVVGYDPFAPPPNLPAGTDPFAIPELRAAFREVPVTADTVVLPR